MNIEPDIKNSTSDAINDIQFGDVFNLEDIQRLQDLFSDASGVASIITHPDGTPITNPSNFCRLCNDIIRKTEKGRANCYHSDAIIGRYNPSGAIIWPCLSGGLWDGGASITVGGKHIANWLIGQVRNEALDEQRMIEYADEIGANKEDILEALNEVPAMSIEQFNKVAKMLFAFASELSQKAYNNLQLKMQIAEQKKATAALLESELKFRNYIDYAPHGVFLADEMGNYVDVNTAASSITGYSKDELLSMKLFELIPEESMEFSARHFEKVVRDGFATGESSFIRKDRSIGYWSVEAVKLSDQRFLGFVVDVTKRKQAEEMLRESIVKYQKIFESTGTATFICDENAIILMVNNECFSILGYTPDELTGQKWIQYFAPESLRKMLKNHQLRRKNHDLVPKNHEVKLVNKKGEKRDVILTVGMISGTKQSIVSISDITERKRAEQAILRSERNFHRSISESPLGIRIVSVDGKTIYANKAFLDIFEFNRLEEFTSLLAINRYTPECYAQHQKRKKKKRT
jgi:PAS domain S-box-containing protein